MYDTHGLTVGMLVVTKPSYGYKLYTRGIMSFTRVQTSGIIIPADNKNSPIDKCGTVYISIAAGIKAAVSIDCLEI